MKWQKDSFDYAVIGDPIKHSLSPEMQNAGFQALGMGDLYTKFHVKGEELGDFVDFARKNLKGFNITVPHKKAIIPFLDGITRPAELAESVNTVSIRDGRLYGDSTDGYGLATAIFEAFGIEVKGRSFFFIGCGGAVQAVAFYFASAGASALYFANRTLAKAELLSRKIAENYPSCQTDCSALDDRTAVAGFVAASDVAVQGTSLGLAPDDPPPLNPELLKDICIYDTIYKTTPLLRYAAENYLKFADGRTMLLHQGARAFEIWTGGAAPVEAMRQALNHAIECKK